MPLSELYRMAKSNLDSTQPNHNAIPTDLSNPENDVFELVWENGHVLSSKTRKNSNFNTRFRDRDTVNGNLINSKMGKFGAFQLTHHYDGNDYDDDDDDDDLVPWLNYHVNGNLPHQYSSDFLPELSGVTVNELPSHNTIASSSINEGGSGGNQVVVRDTHLNSVEYGNVSKLSSLSSVETTRSRSSTNHLYSSASQQCQASFPHLRTKNASNAGKTTSKAPNDSLCGNSPQLPLIAGSSSSAMRQKLDPTPSSNSTNIINFSHFLRPAALLKSNLQNNGVTGTGGSSRIGSLGSMYKDCSATSSQSPDPSLIGMRGSIRKESNSGCKNALMPFIDDNNSSEAKPPDESQVVKQPEVVCLEKSSNKDDRLKQCVDVDTTRELPGGEKAIEHVTAASLCSRYSVEGTSDDPIHNIKKKCHDVEDSEGHSDDVEEESNDVKRATRARGIGFKRSRAAEVHNLSERRRRDRINEKMRALQELIPNCNKVDKASMLDEAIEYLKTLQVQVQIMSMGAGMFMPPMMFPGGMQPMGAPSHMAHYSPMGVGMGMGMGMGFGIGVPDMNGGSHGYPIVQVPHMQGTHFPGQSIPGQTVMHGMPGSNFQVLGLPGQGLHMPMPRAPIAPFSGGPFMSNSCMAVAPLENVGSAAACGSKNVCQNINTSMAPNDGIHTSITPSQANEQASYVNGMAVTSTSKDNLIPN